MTETATYNRTHAEIEAGRDRRNAKALEALEVLNVPTGANFAKAHTFIEGVCVVRTGPAEWSSATPWVTGSLQLILNALADNRFRKGL